ncbi:Ribosome biogenesis protein ytm1 [Neolecta irregularis DAH-3]|uniref:Ribosome biogenesis protein YTM1 n=1 Tax=Neolecta irregularis (strain DAH-3) TaxID=1198029 RepID=A0A1U7LJ07_NEOID|nr:Ribosome biogenesis protein ytm1 [Neolecta irregularis DAH-3]|eukprot:OLL22640.1 Ribosome biogenesis protein ytm1 [Neolecta irregularis DAH-3]
MAQVQVKFTTRHADLKVDQVPILVPLELKRYGLSEVVNHLLASETPIPFEFLIDGELLKMSLANYLTAKGLSTESVISLEYVKSIIPPLFHSSYLHDDWVSSVHVSGQHILTGSYDNIARLWDFSGNVVCTFKGHNRPIKAVKILDGVYLTASMDRSIRVWETTSCRLELVGHKGPIEDIDSIDEKVISACADGMVRVWGISTEYESKSMIQREPLDLLQGHSGPISGIKFSCDSSIIYSCSWDHTLRTWDITTSQQTQLTQTPSPLLCLSYLSTLNLVATGTSTRSIFLHDPRSASIATHTLSGHINMISGLSASPESGYMLVSSSLDSTCKIWDVRAPTGSLYSIKRETGWGQVFCVDWKEIGIVSGGQDTAVQINRGRNLTNDEMQVDSI